MTEASATHVADKTFDYLIVGGGTTGLTLAARLSEDPAVSVAVIEAGLPNLNDPNILVPGQYGKIIGDPKYDWMFWTTKQRHCNDAVSFWPRGKGLGGSSAMNFLSWTKPCTQDADALEKLGNPGWNWENFAKYSKRNETFHEPTEELLSVFPETFDPMNRGKTGPIQTSISPHVHTLDIPFRETLNHMGIRTILDPYGGDISGTWVCTSSLDPRTYTRSYAVTAYYEPTKHRPNLTVLTEATVSRVLFADTVASEKEDLTAMGVEFLWRPQGADAAQCYVVHARKEVILSAGTIKDPQILELSGVGREEVLTKLGIDVKINLPGVGANLQEHIHADMVFELDDKIDHQTLDLLRDPVTAAEHMRLHASQQGLYRIAPTAFVYCPLSGANPQDAPSLLDRVIQGIETEKSSGSLPPGLADQYDLQLRALKDETVPDLQIIAFPGLMSDAHTPRDGMRHVSMVLIMNHPFSRGTIHATSTDPTKPPEIDPHVFENDFDLEVLVQAFKFSRSMAAVEPWKSVAVREVVPGPACSTDDDIREFLKRRARPVWHAVGTCSMLPREKQGVVDSRLKVYGTKNLRVVDISIIPLQMASHTQSVAYYIGEKAADILRGFD